MIHVDVRNGETFYQIETSVDGGPWKVQWLCSKSEPRDSPKTVATLMARAFADGVKFGTGLPVRQTAFGENVS